MVFLTYGSRLTSCTFQFMFGKMYTVFSVKIVFLSALAIFEAGSLLSGIAPTSAALVIGRAVRVFRGLPSSIEGLHVASRQAYVDQIDGVSPL